MPGTLLSDPVTVRVADPATSDREVQVPEPEYWSANDRAITYERSIPPNETVTTAYTFVTDAPTTVDENQPPPALAVDASGPRTEPSDERGDGGVVPPDGRTDTSNPTDGSDEFSMPDDEIPIAALTDGSSPESDDGRDSHAGTVESERSDDVVEALIRTLEGDVTNEQRERLQQALTETVRPRSSLEAQVSHLQSRFEAFASYVDALEEFLDENGTGEELLSDLSEHVETIQADLQELEGEYTALAGRLEDFESRVDDLQATVTERQDDVESDVVELEDTLASVEADQRAIRDQLEQLTAFRESMRTALQEPASPST